MAEIIKRKDNSSTESNAESELLSESRSAARIIPRGTTEAKNEAQQIRERAQTEAENVLQQARAEAETIRAEAREEGLTAGRSEGASQLVEAVTQASLRLNQIESDLVREVKALALGIARKILGKELAMRPEAVVDLIKAALAEKARQRREICLRINPEDYAVVRESKAELIDVLSRAKEISIREDPEVSPKGVVIETDAGIIDAQLETQLGIIEDVIRSMK